MDVTREHIRCILELKEKFLSFQIGFNLVTAAVALFHSHQVFHKLVCPLTVVAPQIFFNLTALFSNLVFFCLLTHLLMLLFTILYFSDPSGLNLFSVLSFCHTDQEFLQWPRGFSSDNVCQGSHWLFQTQLCWRCWLLNPCLYLHCSWWWEEQTSHLSQLGRFPTHWDLSAFRGQTWV